MLPVLPSQVWNMIVLKVAARESVDRQRTLGGEVTAILRLLTINKPILSLARAAVALLGRAGIRCTVAQIPHAILAFGHARELRIVGESEVEDGRDDQAALDALVASEALAKTGGRFRVFVSDVTDSASKMGWLPMLPRREGPEESAVMVVCECYETKTFETAAANLAKNYDAGWMTHLVIDYLGGRDEGGPLASGFPTLGRFQGGAGLRVTLQQGDFEALDSQEANLQHFQSTCVTWLELMYSDSVSVPPVRGFPNLKRLDVIECVFANLANADADVLRPLSYAPVPPIEYLAVVGCDGVDDASPIVALTNLSTLVMYECRGEYPDFDHDAGVLLKNKLLAGELNKGGTGRLCKLLVRRLGIRKAENERRLGWCSATQSAAGRVNAASAATVSERRGADRTSSISKRARFVLALRRLGGKAHRLGVNSSTVN